jgi:hypothetical protein
MPVALLSQALLDLREARRNPEATRQAVIRYFRGGVGMGMELGNLVEWLFFWPSQRDSVFGQAGYSHRESIEFVEMVKRMSIQEIGLDDTTSAA